MRKIQKIIPQALDDELLRLGAARKAMSRWDEVVGASLATRSWPDRYDRGVVWVAVAGSAWAQELRLMKYKILAKLGEISGEPSLFSDIRFGVRPLASREMLQQEPDAVPIEAKKEELSISEIARKRLEKWRDVDPT